MKKHRSFKPSDFSLSDFSLRNIGGFLAGYLVIAVFAVGIGLFLEALPDFWSGILLGGGLALMGAFLLFVPKHRKIDAASLPRPSAEVMAKCEDPDCSPAEAAKAYREETGLGLYEAKVFIDSCRARGRHPGQDDTSA